MKTLQPASVQVITDPPYGENIGAMNFTNNVNGGVTLRNDYSGKADWDKEPMSIEQYQEIIRVSKEIVVIFGGNFFGFLPVSRG